jgi:tetratricopeptide (TPR) repeat protein
LSAATTDGTAWMSRVLETSEGAETVDRGRAIAWLGTFAQAEGDFPGAARYGEQAHELFEKLGELHHAARALSDLSYSAFWMGEVERARLYVERGRDQARQLEDDFLLAELLSVESLVETFAGDYDRAQIAVEEALALLRKLRVPRRLWLHQLVNVGWIALHRHDFDRAREALEEYLAAESWKNPVGIANGHGNLGLVAVYEADREQADEHFRKALERARVARAGPTIAEALFGLAAVAAMDSDAERAVRLWGAAGGLKAAMQAALSAPEEFIVERYLGPAGASLPGDVRAQVAAEGGAMSLDEAVAYALDKP